MKLRWGAARCCLVVVLALTPGMAAAQASLSNSSKTTATNSSSSAVPPAAGAAAADNRSDSPSLSPATMPHYQGFGSSIPAYRQCGGAGGLCNTTTIGTRACEDGPWPFTSCATPGFSCTRISSYLWTCLLARNTSNAAAANSGSSNSSSNSSQQAPATAADEPAARFPPTRLVQNATNDSSEVLVQGNCAQGELAIGATCFRTASASAAAACCPSAIVALPGLLAAAAALVLAAVNCC